MMITNPKLLNPLSLAFIGDGVYEIMVREYIIKMHGSLSANKLHKHAVKLVCATAQSEVYGILEGIITEEEMDIMKRGRNANSTTSPKNANPSDYRRATGVEALWGYLYLSGKEERLNQLFNTFIQPLNKQQ